MEDYLDMFLLLDTKRNNVLSEEQLLELTKVEGFEKTIDEFGVKTLFATYEKKHLNFNEF